MYLLEMKNELGQTVNFPLAHESAIITIGRRKENDIVLSDLSVSRNHARIVVKEDSVFIEDLNSANGTLINGAAIDHSVAIKIGDEILIGENRLFLRKKDTNRST